MGIFRQSYLNDKEIQMPFFYYIAATMCVGIRTYTRMQSFFSSPKDFYSASDEKLERTGIFTKKQLNRFKEAKKLINPLKDYYLMEKAGIRLIPIESDEYPEKIKGIKDAPAFLFVAGRPPEKERVNVAVIGARECSQYGSNVAKRIGEVLAENKINVISGMARGIDSISQRAAVQAGGYSLAFIGGGVDVCYPEESRTLYRDLLKMGGIMSEFPPGTVPLKQYFAMRNRLISGISDVVCVVEAKEKSGTMITVDCALDQGKEIYAVPGRITDITSYGVNELIRQGAGIIMDPSEFANEIIERFGNEPKYSLTEGKTLLQKTGDRIFNDLSNEEKKVLLCIDDNSFTPEQISIKASMPGYELLNACIILSSKGILNSKGGGRFVLTEYGNKVRNLLI